MTVEDLGPLDWRIAIVDKTGRPTPEFQRRWAIQRNNNALIGTISFGSGVPTSSDPDEGAEYVNTASVPYILYVGHNGTWHQVGVDTFLQLADTPSSYSGQANKLVAVNPGATGLTFVNPPTSSSGGGGGMMPLDGDDGEMGLPGPPGPQGPTGPQGTTGSTGPQGLQGISGIPGLDGDEGPEGMAIPGPQGMQGIQGVPGVAGIMGMLGQDGEDGQNGIPGLTGATGATGATGPQGPAGFMGFDGSDGDVGDRGPPGPQGLTGAQGATGPQGPIGFGLDGADADDSYGYQPLMGFLPLTGGIMTGPITTPDGTKAAPAINIGANTNPAGFYTDGTNLFLTINGTNGTVGELSAHSWSVVATGQACQYYGQRAEATLGTNYTCCSILGQGPNSTGSLPANTWAQIDLTARVPTAGSEEGEIIFRTYHGGSLQPDFTIDAGVLYAGNIAGQPVVDALGGIVGILASPYSYIVPATGFSHVIGNAINFYIMNPAGTLAAGTLTMPAAPDDGQEVSIISSQTITTLTVNANAGQTILGGGPNTLLANGYIRWKYVASITTWFRVG